jgi:hypothetical protein
MFHMFINAVLPIIAVSLFLIFKKIEQAPQD